MADGGLLARHGRREGHEGHIAAVGVGRLGWEGWVGGWVGGSEAAAVGLEGMPHGRQWQRHSAVVLGVVGGLLLSWLVFVLFAVDCFDCCGRSPATAVEVRLQR